MQELHRGGAPDARKVTTREVTTVKELTPIPPKGGSGQASKFAYTEDFTAFWQAYPRKTGKKAAAKAYAKAIKEGATPQELVQGAARLAADPNRVDQYTPHPATWLNQGRWEDETPLPARQTGGITANQHSRMAAIFAAGAAIDAAQDLRTPRIIEGGEIDNRRMLG
ncbi:hypothetical protein [Winkia neuii]|uniref:hypothetical protein n=1 Tax=Winkia neuii TaxID=33007 RepID=UPI001E34BF32|nr:hypothetical protein [Winkia neuii]